MVGLGVQRKRGLASWNFFTAAPCNKGPIVKITLNTKWKHSLCTGCTIEKCLRTALTPGTASHCPQQYDGSQTEHHPNEKPRVGATTLRTKLTDILTRNGRRLCRGHHWDAPITNSRGRRRRNRREVPNFSADELQKLGDGKITNCCRRLGREGWLLTGPHRLTNQGATHGRAGRTRGSDC